MRSKTIDALITFFTGLSTVTCFTGAAALGAGPVTVTAGVDALALRHVALKSLPAAVAHAHTLAVLSVPAAKHGTRHCNGDGMKGCRRENK